MASAVASFLKSTLAVGAMTAGVFLAPACFAFMAFVDIESNKERHEIEQRMRKPWARVGNPMIRADQPDLSLTAVVIFCFKIFSNNLFTRFYASSSVPNYRKDYYLR